MTRPRDRAMARQFWSVLVSGTREEVDETSHRLDGLRAGESLLFASELQALFLEKDEAPVTNPDFDYAGGDCRCVHCDGTFYQHSPAFEHLGYDGLPYLTRLCDGRLVKL